MTGGASRNSAAVARWDHSPKVGGSNPSSATKTLNIEIMTEAKILEMVQETAKKVPQVSNKVAFIKSLYNPLKEKGLSVTIVNDKYLTVEGVNIQFINKGGRYVAQSY